MTANSLIDLVLEEIAKTYQAGTLPWIKANRPGEWGKMLTLEEKVNSTALGDNMEGLREALSEYQRLMVKEFKTIKEKKEQGMFNFQSGRQV